jgi:hypothetical protein
MPGDTKIDHKFVMKAKGKVLSSFLGMINAVSPKNIIN